MLRTALTLCCFCGATSSFLKLNEPCWYFTFLAFSPATLVAQRLTMWRWTSGTLARIERTLVWKTWNIGCELKLWSLQVKAALRIRALLLFFFPSLSSLFDVCGFMFLQHGQILVTELFWFTYNWKWSYSSLCFLVLSLSGGFARSELMSGHLIDFFVPFLPLEYRHVKLCAQDAYAARGLEANEATLDEVAKAMLYVPKEERLFSAQGCKSIPQRINFFLP